MNKQHVIYLICVLSLLLSSFLWLASCGEREELPPSELSFSAYEEWLKEGEELSGGTTTVEDVTRNAYSNTARNILDRHHADFFVGNSFFNNSWVIAPASTAKRDGLGPVFNARSCSSCHFKDGRGRPPLKKDERILSMLIRLSIPGTDQFGGPKPEPRYGGQFNTRSIPGVDPEGDVSISTTTIQGAFSDGTPYTLHKPIYKLEELSYGPLHLEVLTSPRVAPSVFGLGLLESIPEASILELADPDDTDKDGISGRPNLVWDVIQQKHVLGRFGWKANQPNLRQQNAAAFLGDIGITSPLFPKENCTSEQTDCQEAQTGGSPEIDEDKVKKVTVYTKLLAVPLRRNWDQANILHGKKLFFQAGCTKCHTPQLKTGENKEFPELSNQTIYPYTDLLLHDMGEGLSDGRSDFKASGREWRTPPLWGVGLLKTVNRHQRLLHDGRANGFTEAILWHGGEASSAKKAFLEMSQQERNNLVAFLESL